MRSFKEYIYEAGQVKGQDGSIIKKGDKVEIAKYDPNQGAADFKDSFYGKVVDIENDKALVYADGETEITDPKLLRKKK